MIWSNHPAPHTAFDKAIIAASHRAHVEPINPDPRAGARVAAWVLLALPFWMVVAAGVAWVIWGARP